MKGFGSAALLLLLVACVYTEAKECNKICTREYIPVCGSDGKTYGNKCTFDSAACETGITLDHLGACEVAKECPMFCTYEYNPVCGSDGKTYGNKCAFDGAACKSDITLAHHGECKVCPKFCTREFAPVCGSDGKTYGNKCMLDVAACKTDITLDHHGKCEVVHASAPNCPLMCTMEYNPQCGSDGNTYGNKCMLNGAACRSGNAITLSHAGQC